MQRNFWMKQLPLAVLATGLVLASTAFQTKPGSTANSLTDTVPAPKKARTLDEAIAELEKGSAEIDKAIRETDWNKINADIKASMKEIDADKIRAEVDKAMKEIDFKKIQADIDKAMKEIDMVKVQSDINKAMSEIDLSKMKEDIARSLKDIDVAKIQADVKAAIAQVDIDKIKADIDLKGLQAELKDLQPTIEKSMAEAREGIARSKAELESFRSFIDGLDKDGLIQKEKEYSITYKSGKLTVNGKEQPESVVKKYDSFLKNRKDFTLRNNGEGFNLSHD